MSTNSAHHRKNIQINESLCFVEVFQACLFGTAQTTLRKETCEKDIGEEQSKHILKTIRRLFTIIVFLTLSVLLPS